MSFKTKATILSALSCLTLAACGTTTNINPHSGQYWQRASVSDAAYQQGPKAQQMLNKDIASCVTELKELENLGQIRQAIPADPHTGKVYSDDEMALMRQDTPTREKFLFAEHGNYHDFESCMLAKGWERVMHVPYHVAHESRKAYLKNHVDYKYQTRYEGNPPSVPTTQEDGPYANLND